MIIANHHVRLLSILTPTPVPILPPPPSQKDDFVINELLVFVYLSIICDQSLPFCNYLSLHCPGSLNILLLTWELSNQLNRTFSSIFLHLGISKFYRYIPKTLHVPTCISCFELLHHCYTSFIDLSSKYGRIKWSENCQILKSSNST